MKHRSAWILARRQRVVWKAGNSWHLCLHARTCTRCCANPCFTWRHGLAQDGAEAWSGTGAGESPTPILPHQDPHYPMLHVEERVSAGPSLCRKHSSAQDPAQVPAWGFRNSSVPVSPHTPRSLSPELGNSRLSPLKERHPQRLPDVSP